MTKKIEEKELKKPSSKNIKTFENKMLNDKKTSTENSTSLKNKESEKKPSQTKEKVKLYIPEKKQNSKKSISGKVENFEESAFFEKESPKDLLNNNRTKSAKKISNFKSRRKTSLALIKKFEHKPGQITINNVEFSKYFKISYFSNIVLRPFKILNQSGFKISHSDYSIFLYVTGGGFSSQAEAVSKSIAKKLSIDNEEYRKYLKLSGLLSTDTRNVERKLPGLRKSRKKEQFSKR